MKRVILIFMVVTLWLAAPASATLSLGWWNEGDASTTHQLWDFTPGHILASGGGYTAVPETVISPESNRVAATILGGHWDGVTLITSSTYIYVDLEIPNYENLNDHKEIWVDIGNAVTSGISVTPFASGSNVNFRYSILPGQGDAEFGIMIWPNPYIEKIDFVIMANSAPAVLDYIHVDTICIPEPATIALLGLGVLGLLRKKR